MVKVEKILAISGLSMMKWENESDETGELKKRISNQRNGGWNRNVCWGEILEK